MSNDVKLTVGVCVIVVAIFGSAWLVSHVMIELAGVVRADLQALREPNQIEACSETVSRVFASRCAGDIKPPTAAELYDAMRQKEPNERGQSVLCSRVMHATIEDLWWAWSERADSLAYARPRDAARGATVVGGVPVR